MSNCRLIVRLLSAYIDGELNGQEMMEVRQHLGVCANCAAEHGSMVRMKHALAGMPMRRPADDFESRLLRHLFDGHAKVRMSRWQLWLADVYSILTAPVNRRRLAVLPAGLAGVAVWVVLATNPGDNGAMVVGSGLPISTLSPHLMQSQPYTDSMTLAPMTTTFFSQQPNSLDPFQNDHATYQLNDFGAQSNGVGHIGYQPSFQSVGDISVWSNRP